MAVSVELLSLYTALFERSCNAINALATALKRYYNRRGFRMTNRQVSDTITHLHLHFHNCVRVQLCGSHFAVVSVKLQWFNILQSELEKQVDSIVQQCRDLAKPAIESFPPHPSSSSAEPQAPFRGTCVDVLIQRCPACFGGTCFGRSLKKSGDIHVAMHGNFHHRHRHSAGDCSPFYHPQYFIPKTQVDAIGRHIVHAHQRPTEPSQSTVPDKAIDQCEASYEAADGHKQKAAMDNFDDTRVMALICHHDIPLFFANIDMPGEQQKYSIALIDHLFSLLPSQANVVVLYDVGCVLDRSLSKVCM